MSTAQETAKTASSNVFNDLQNQEIRKLVFQKGIYCIGAVEKWEMNDKSGNAGFIQLLVPQSDDSAAVTLMRIKVPEERFGMIDILNQKKQFQIVDVQIEVTESYGKVKYVMTEEQPRLRSE